MLAHELQLDLSLMEFPDSLFENVDTIIHLAGLAHDSKSNKENFHLFIDKSQNNDFKT